MTADDVRNRVHGTPGASLIRGTELDVRRSLIGAKGEEMTARALEQVLRDDPNAHVFHSVRLPYESWDIDHVLVTVSEGAVIVVVIDSKRWKGDVSYHFAYDYADDKHLALRDGLPFDGGRVSSLSEADSLFDYLMFQRGLRIDHLRKSCLLVIDNEVEAVTVDHSATLVPGMNFPFFASSLADMRGYLPTSFMPPNSTSESFSNVLFLLEELVAWQDRPDPVPTPPVLTSTVNTPNPIVTNNATVPYGGPTTFVNPTIPASPFGGFVLALSILFTFTVLMTWPLSLAYALVMGILMIRRTVRGGLYLSSVILSAVTGLIGGGFFLLFLILSMISANA